MVRQRSRVRISPEAFEKMRLTILGPPGSGKGSYASRLGNNFKVDVISVGDILREEVSNKSELGLKVKKFMSKGGLVPDEIILEIVNERVAGKDDVVFDGFPRTMKQINVDVDKAVNLVCSDEVIITRMLNRRICNKCKKIYNIITEKPKKENKCDVCNGKLVSRSDQTEDVIRERLKVFKRETLPVINYYKKNGLLIDIDGERSIDEVYIDIRKLFKLKK